jgi:hypothetical protein
MMSSGLPRVLFGANRAGLVSELPEPTRQHLNLRAMQDDH